MIKKIEISYRTIIFTFLVIGIIWFLYYIHDIIFSMFVALLIMVILNPFVRKLSKYKVPRELSILVVYFSVIGLIVISLASIVPPLIEQSANLANSLPAYLSKSPIPPAFTGQIYNQIISQLANLPGQVLDFGLILLSHVVEIITTLILAFYLLLARNKIDDHLEFVFGTERSKDVSSFLDELEVRLGGWARGQFILMVTIGLFTYIGLRIVGIPFALPLAILGGLLEIVPYVGPIFSAIPAVIIGFSMSPVMGFGTMALVFLIHQMENYVFVPKIMEKSVGLSPLVTLLALSIGARIAGITGIFVSIPFVIFISILLKRHPIWGEKLASK